MEVNVLCTDVVKVHPIVLFTVVVLQKGYFNNIYIILCIHESAQIVVLLTGSEI